MTTNTNTKRVPYFILPQNLHDMSDDDLDEFLEGVRERRLRYIKELQEAERLKHEARVEKLRDKLDKQMKMLGKEITRLDKVIAALDKRITNIQAIKIEMGVEVDL